MTIVQGQFAFFGEVAMITGQEGTSPGMVDSTTRAMPGLIHACIHRRIDSEGIVIYEARTGNDDDVRTYRRALESHLVKQRWYRHSDVGQIQAASAALRSCGPSAW